MRWAASTHKTGKITTKSSTIQRKRGIVLRESFINKLPDIQRLELCIVALYLFILMC